MTGIYIAYPFCSQKCTFCNFASGVLPTQWQAPYAAALLREMRAAEFAGVPDTVYIGGGTPSTMHLDQLESVLAAIPGEPWREATIEAAPGTVTAERAARWKAAGINRVSLGVQSFVPAELRRTGRTHDAEVVAAEVDRLRSAGLENISIDLIAGLPAQTEASWSESLDWIRRLDPPHVSVYMLEVDEDSRLGHEMLLGGVRYGAADAPDDDQTAALYEAAVQRLSEMEIERYEISNFARRGYESRHNLKYWQRLPYRGFGADAHSFVNGRRWQNVESAEDYIRLSPHAQIEETLANESEEKFLTGLRLTAGIVIDAADRARHGVTIQRFVDGGLMEREGDRVRLTARGVMVSNDVIGEFLPA